VLPSIPATDGLLDNDVLSHCQHKVRRNTLSSLFSLTRKHPQSADHNVKLLLKLEVKFMMMMVEMDGVVADHWSKSTDFDSESPSPVDH